MNAVRNSCQSGNNALCSWNHSRGFTIEEATEEGFQFIAVGEALDLENVGGMCDPTFGVLGGFTCEWDNGVNLGLEDQCFVRHC